jgi:outer membrane lipoprotein-sorting protein
MIWCINNRKWFTILIYFGISFTLFSKAYITAEPIDGDTSITVGPITPNQVLNRMARVYRKCESYLDSGISINTYTSNDGTKKQLRYEFRTAFQRGKKFRFAYRENPFGRGYYDARILWHDGKQTMVNSVDSDEFTVEESLGLAVAGLTGVSAGTAHTIPALLMPREIKGRRITEISAIKPLTTEIIEQRECYRIEGKFSGDKTVLWIDKNLFLLVKMEENYFVNGILRQRTTSYIPTLNEKIPDRLFKMHVEGEWEVGKQSEP